LAAALNSYIADQSVSRMHFPKGDPPPDYGKPLALEACTECHDRGGQAGSAFQGARAPHPGFGGLRLHACETPPDSAGTGGIEGVVGGETLNGERGRGLCFREKQGWMAGSRFHPMKAASHKRIALLIDADNAPAAKCFASDEMSNLN